MLSEQQIQVWNTWMDLQRAFPAIETNAESQTRYQEWWAMYFNQEKSHRLKPIMVAEPKIELIPINISTELNLKRNHKMLFMGVEDIIEFEESNADRRKN